MREKKLFHIGKNGPAPCNATKRACRYSSDLHGNEKEMIIAWENSQEDEYKDLLKGFSKKDKGSNSTYTGLPVEPPTKAIHPYFTMVNSALESRHYQSAIPEFPYSKDSVEVAKALTAKISNIGFNKILQEDSEWRNNGKSSVKRLKLADGSFGYFKSVKENSRNEYYFMDHNTSSLEAAANEVIAYRIAETLGGEYRNLVPETSLTVYKGELGTIQKEAIQSNDEVTPDLTNELALREDYKRAAIFDYVTGSIDRHRDNVVFTERDGVNRISLIDNSFSCLKYIDSHFYNKSIFADNQSLIHAESKSYETAYRMTESEGRLTSEEKDSLRELKLHIEDWEHDKEIDGYSASSIIRRIDSLLESGSIVDETSGKLSNFMTPDPNKSFG